MSKIITELSNQALLARVSVLICRDISSLTDVIVRIKQNILKGADSQIDTAIQRSNLNLDPSFHHELNLSSIEPPSSRMQTVHGVVEILDQNLYGSESNIDCFYKVGNVRLKVIPLSRIGEVRYLNLHGSESYIDEIHEGGNGRPLVMPQSRIVRVQDQYM